MALATLPPAVEIVEAFKSGPERSKDSFSGPRHNLSEPYWAISGSSQQSPWKLTAFSKISMLRNTGKPIPGLGDFRISDQAATELRKLIGEIQIESLPLPTVAPVSGGAIFVSWQSGAKSVEATAYHDGEIVIEALENQRLNEEKSKGDLPSILWWLVQG